MEGTIDELMLNVQPSGRLEESEVGVGGLHFGWIFSGVYCNKFRTLSQFFIKIVHAWGNFLHFESLAA